MSSITDAGQKSTGCNSGVDRSNFISLFVSPTSVNFLGGSCANCSARQGCEIPRLRRRDYTLYYIGDCEGEGAFFGVALKYFFLVEFLAFLYGILFSSLFLVFFSYQFLFL